MGQYGRGYWNDLMNGLIQTLQASSGANGVNWVGEPGGGGTKGETVGGQVSVRELKRLPALLLHYRDSTVASYGHHSLRCGESPYCIELYVRASRCWAPRAESIRRKRFRFLLGD